MTIFRPSADKNPESCSTNCSGSLTDLSTLHSNKNFNPTNKPTNKEDLKAHVVILTLYWVLGLKPVFPVAVSHIETLLSMISD